MRKMQMRNSRDKSIIRYHVLDAMANIVNVVDIPAPVIDDDDTSAEIAQAWGGTRLEKKGFVFKPHS